MSYKEEQDDDDWDDPASDEDTGDPETEPTIDCPYCGHEMLEVCLQCPSCEMYVSKEDLGREKRPWWITLAIILSLLGIASWFLFP
jgi:hypothetical protein